MLAFDQADRKKVDGLDKIQLAKSKLALQKKLLEDMKGGLSIRAPADGVFLALTGIGLFSRKGHVLGELSA
jgi:hypothetical protein